MKRSSAHPQRCYQILRQTPVEADSIDQLRKLLNVASGGVVLTPERPHLVGLRPALCAVYVARRPVGQGLATVFDRRRCEPSGGSSYASGACASLFAPQRRHSLGEAQRFEQFAVPIVAVLEEFVVGNDFDIRAKVPVVEHVTRGIRCWIKAAFFEHSS